MTTMQKLLYSDSISILDFALALAEYNPEIGDFTLFYNLIYDSIEAGTLEPIPLQFNYTTPFRERDFKFSPSTLIQWAERKKFRVQQINTDSIVNKWRSAPHYKNEWQSAADKYKKENPRWKKSEIANAIHSDYIKMDDRFPHSARTVERNILIATIKKQKSAYN